MSPKTTKPENPTNPGNTAKLTNLENRLTIALNPESNYFMTSHLYWDCDCPQNYIRPRSMNMCEDCGALKDDSPDSRLSEIRAAGIHIPWTEPEFAMTLEEHNKASQTRIPGNPDIPQRTE